MTQIRPFRALRYDPARTDLARVIVPPYDVITPAERTAFYERDPHNAIRMELTREVGQEATTDYSEVSDTLQAWRESGVLRREPAPALYALRQRFTAPDGRELGREGFFAALRLEDYDDRVVLPHERTLSGPKADRLKLLRATRANLSSVFMLYQDPEQKVASAITSAFAGGDCVAAVDGQGVEQTLAPLRDADAVAAIQAFLADRAVVIADGHHRYETALAYRDEQRAAAGGRDAEAPFEFTLAYFANAYAPGSLLLPIHRVVRRGAAPDDAAWSEKLPEWKQETVPLAGVDAVERVLAEVLAPHAGAPACAADDGSGTLRIFSRPDPGDGELMVRRLEREVLGAVFDLDPEAIREGAVSFPKSAPRAAEEVREGEGSVALYLNPLTPDDVFRVTGAGEVLPQKSTFFFPKIPSGLVFRPHDDAA
ncbi:MAG: DUF1015 domain-containing protein [Proteobacteria bacterium]|nr:DUF1015 domain-containing protein [Pseudomonadota bacterium]